MSTLPDSIGHMIIDDTVGGPDATGGTSTSLPVTVSRTPRLPDQCPRCAVVDSDRIRSWRDSRDVIWQVRQCAACLVLWLELPR